MIKRKREKKRNLNLLKKKKKFLDAFRDYEQGFTPLFSEKQKESIKEMDKIADELNQNIRLERERLPERLEYMQEIKNEISKIDFQLSKFIELIKSSSNVPNTIVDEMAKLEDRKVELSDEMKRLQALQREIDDYTKEDIIPMLTGVEELLEEANSIEEKRKFVESFIPRIDIYPYEKAVAQMTLPAHESFCGIRTAGDPSRTIAQCTAEIKILFTEMPLIRPHKRPQVVVV